MAQEVEVKVKVDTGQAVEGVNNLEKSFGKLDRSVGTSKEKSVDYGKQILHNSQLSQKLSQATGGMSDAFMNAVKGIDLTNISLKGMKTAIMSTGVGLLVIAIGELVTYLAELYSSEKKSEKALDDMTSALDRQSDAFDELTESSKFALDIQQKYAKANGATKEQLKKTNDAYLESERKRIEKELVLLQMEHMAVLNNDKLSEEDRKKATENVNAQMKKLMGMRLKNSRDKQTADADDYAQTKEAQKQASDKTHQKAVSDGEKAKQLRIQQQTALENLEKKYADDIENLGDKTEEEKLATQKARALKELEEIKLSAKEKANAKLLIEQDFQLKEEALVTAHSEKVLALTNKLEEDKNSLMAKTDEEKLKLSQDKSAKQLEVDLANINATEPEKQLARKKLQETFDLQDAELATAKKVKADEERVAMIELDLENEAISFEDKKALVLEREALLLSDKTLTESQKVKIHKDAVDAETKIDEEQQKGKMELMKAVSDSLDIASEVVGKNTAVGKTMAVASALMNTYQGITAGVKLGYPQAIPAVLAASVTGFKAVKSILAVKTPNGGGASASTGSMSTPTMSAPSINVVGASSTNAIAETIAKQGQQPVKAYVVANDVTTQQGLDRNIVSSATLG